MNYFFSLLIKTTENLKKNNKWIVIIFYIPKIFLIVRSISAKFGPDLVRPCENVYGTEK